MRRFAWLLLAVGLAVGAAMIVVVSDEITKPIRELHRSVEIIGGGNLDHRVEIKTGDEIEQLAEGFNKMAAELKTSYSTLEQKVAQRTHELSVLYDVTATVNQLLDLDMILKEVIQKILEVMRFDAVRVYLLDAEGKELRMRAHHGIGPKFASQTATDPVGVGITGTVAATGKPLLFEDIQTDLEYARLARGRLAQEMGFHAHISFPLRTKTKTLGVINFLSYQARTLLPNEIALLTAMANQIGIALENAGLFADLREKTVELGKVNVNLVEANRAKAEFMAAMSHELRTPLNVIIGNADLAKDGFFGQVTPQQKEAMEKILRYSKVLLKLVNDVLTLTRIEAKKMTLEVSTFHLEEILFHIRTYTEQLNRDKRLGILWKVDSRLPPLTTDAMKLEEILQNLIGNAFKFTPKGKIELRVRDLPTKGRVEFAVVDTGIGIDEGNLQKIFEEFHQLKDAHTGDYTGVGLGLSIVKKYLELMQGEIQVESRPGMGSVFVFTLPYSV
jgi:signal transduction histidine kinase